MQPHTVGKSALGGIKTKNRDTEEQIESESRMGEKLRDEVLTVGVFESVRQATAKEPKCEWRVRLRFVTVAFTQGSGIALDYFLQMFFVCRLHFQAEWSLMNEISHTRTLAIQVWHTVAQGINQTTTFPSGFSIGLGGP